ncbi:MAG: 4-hydroxy-3-methylbut-2-enyl diphosphate reductase [Pseudomonadota bacterium]|nr:4-hydroxy-3-methylbut-2-enyl diphosphate reductase [Pseudomonadota bacterium]MEC8288152.1 4-hydroxy-3-methylbut-2-enyl diphosphate reductase [Pseudomonadota bacterium]MEC8531246.1 4-hydroxy-3-methylbut-2-enyl diphosphate reductase [Pseudomonadota bacterium]MEC8726263.1 4-hydroxy-3-methylbut-2-enyl diphosphate reductase [Pseudomonadota bacterium]MEC9206322.1 4-hydroxy-3-methylbut-2-enyl diphosphate reductase [Pseudomonadota bacterium]
MIKRPLKVLLAGPRGFCAGVDRAIKIVELALEKHGDPVYVRHEIVHNRFVVQRLEEKGAIFVDELNEVPEDAPVVFSAHGVPKSVFAEAKKRDLYYLDATCPLVTKVHVDTARHRIEGKDLILIGHKGHPEVIGTMGQLPDGEIILVENAEQAEILEVRDPENLAYVTQTTLSVDDTAEIVKILQRRFPTIEAPRTEDICYATTNRQAAVKNIANECDAIIVLGAPNSSNSNRLSEVALTIGCPKSALIQRATDLDNSWLDDVETLGVTAGASAPEVLVQELITALKHKYNVTIEERNIIDENINFSLPRTLSA